MPSYSRKLSCLTMNIDKIEIALIESFAGLMRHWVVPHGDEESKTNGERSGRSILVGRRARFAKGFSTRIRASSYDPSGARSAHFELFFLWGNSLNGLNNCRERVQIHRKIIYR
jgi:hypothetical protein